jgi:hypothetical protein
MHFILLLLAGGLGSVAPATPRRLRVVTVASNLGDPRLVYATSSAQHFGLEITVLGAGRKAWWPEGLGLKINLVREYARSLANDEDVILVIDAYDVVVLADASDILRRFDTFEKGSVIFNGETCVVAAFVFAFGQLLSTAQTITKGSSRTPDLHSRPPPPRFSLSLSPPSPSLQWLLPLALCRAVPRGRRGRVAMEPPQQWRVHRHRWGDKAANSRCGAGGD